MAHIQFTSGPLAQRSITLQGEMHLGRASDAEIHLDDPAVSGHHARLVLTPSGEVVLTDLQSANGTLVNGNTITRVTLRESDMVEIGLSRFTVHIGSPVAAPRPAPVVAQPPARPVAAPTPPPAPPPRPAPVTPPLPAAPVAAPRPPTPAPAPVVTGEPRVVSAAPVAQPRPPEPARQPEAPRPRPIASVIPPASATQDDVLLVEKMQEFTKDIRREVAKVIIGQIDVLEEVLMCMIAGGHALLIGMPGMAKTTMVRTISQVLDLNFKRIQFTPDLMPTDITGTEVLETDRTTQEKNFRFIAGPLFCNMLLADEINRTPPKTQAALLEAMQEKSVTIGNKTYKLDAPFFVLATQNPIEQEGTYPLPEAQMDRFMFNIWVDYPKEDEEEAVVKSTTVTTAGEPQVVISKEQLLQLQSVVRKIPVSDHVIKYAVRLARATRPAAEGTPDFIKQHVHCGAGPRAGQFLVLAAKARAVLDGRIHVGCSDIRKAALPVLRHRILTNFAADAEGLTSSHLVKKLLDAIPEPSENDYNPPAR